MPLLLFDIDGTLLTGSDGTLKTGLGPYNSSLEQAIQEVFGREISIDTSNISGKTDRRILIEHLDNQRVIRPVHKVDKCLLRFGEIYQADSSQTVLTTGVEETLPVLREEHLMGLLTGNVEQMARKKLAMFSIDGMKLNDYFPFGGFGNWCYQRSNLVGVAIAEARQYEGRPNLGFNQRHQIYGIDDSPIGVNAIKQAGAVAIGVTTGENSRQELEQAGAHYVIDNIGELTDMCLQ